ncbi:protein-glutamate methylesterase/protein-glutamine glutaminase [Paenibacillus mendelii]|uniref:Protein-glutamate methylesterase/protein-glutamine glutaminase n=1 Tax=Paenibacillus mendelii TaxID=206163 RepID=A0ABV6JH33_9BACL|nr:chemotaxis response regulator protein-glutamate methylesterase [Paenibacillus mendelii]MCQ6557899.1 chemotaxis response regulator protein-glutamate methylesterase [Paenibacillus mendelii]
MTSYRVLVVDDSAFMRKIISDLITADKQFEIIATATNGQEAIDAVEQWKPDVITLDLEMPEMNGLEALGHIMRKRPTPIIMMSSTSDDGTRETIKALQYGAFDFIRKPAGPLSPDIQNVGEQLLEKLRIAVLTRRPSIPADSIFTRPLAPAELHKQNGKEKPLKPGKKEAAETKPVRPKLEPVLKKERIKPAVLPSKPAVTSPEELFAEQAEPPKSSSKPKPTLSFRHLVAIGTSTGGPRALHEVISSLPGSFPAPVLVVQHMPPKFTHSLAQRLNTFSALHVKEAEGGERVYAGIVYIAPGGFHMELAKDASGYYIKLTQSEPRSGHRPSVDVMFESCVPYPELQRHSVIMTGMGSDGVKGMKALKDSGAQSAIAEAEESCVVYGMPRSAIEAGVATSVVPLKKIASTLVDQVMK